MLKIFDEVKLENVNTVLHHENKNGIISYVERQNLTFQELSFNEVDALVLSQFIYLKLDGVVGGISEKKEAVSLKEIFQKADLNDVFQDVADI